MIGSSSQLLGENKTCSKPPTSIWIYSCQFKRPFIVSRNPGMWAAHPVDHVAREIIDVFHIPFLYVYPRANSITLW